MPLVNPAGQYYTAQVPANNQFNATDLNALDSLYASLYGHDTTDLISRVLYYNIFNAAPMQYYPELRILGMQDDEEVLGDEIFFRESQWAREPIVLSANFTGGMQTGTISVTNESCSVVSQNTLCVLSNNQMVTIQSINPSANTMVISAQTGMTLPNLLALDTISNASSVEGSGSNSISQYFRLNTIERYNYLQRFIKASRFDTIEYQKYLNLGTTDYLSRNRQELMDQHRTDVSNVFWNGTQGEVMLADGSVAKTAGGVFPTMQAGGSPFITCSITNLAPAVTDLALNTEYGEWGDTKYLFGTNRNLFQLSQQLRAPLQRYLVGDTKAELYFQGIEMGSTKILFCPMKRWEDNASFPSSFSDRLMLLDMKNIRNVMMKGVPAKMGSTLNRDQGTYNDYTDEWVSCMVGQKFNNPPSCGWIDITP